MEGSNSRFITNSFLHSWYTANVTTEQTARIFMRRLDHFFNNISVPNSEARCSVPAHSETSFSIFEGAGGYLHLYIKLYEFFKALKPEQITSFGKACDLKDSTFSKLTMPSFYLQAAEAQYTQLDRDVGKLSIEPKQISFCFSHYPIYLSGAKLAFFQGSAEEFQRNVALLMGGFRFILKNHKPLECEILYGIPGYLIMLLELQRWFQFQQPQVKDFSVNVMKEVETLVEIVLGRGVENYQHKAGTKVDLNSKLPEDFHLAYLFGKSQSQYLGGAHGLGGVLNVLLLAYQLNSNKGFSKELNLKLKTCCTKSVQFLLTQRVNNNFRSSVSTKPPSSKYTQFCHGNPGIVTPLLHFCELFPQEAKALNLLQIMTTHLDKIFEEGILKKGYWGLCHGVSGNIYPLISPVFHRVLPEASEDFLKKAQIMWSLQENVNVQSQIMNFEFQDRLVRGISDYPYSLMLGEAGDLCLGVDLLLKEGCFPGFDL